MNDGVLGQIDRSGGTFPEAFEDAIAPDSPICLAVMTVTDAGAFEIGISVFVAASTFGCSSPKRVTSPIDLPVCAGCC